MTTLSNALREMSHSNVIIRRSDVETRPSVVWSYLSDVSSCFSDVMNHYSVVIIRPELLMSHYNDVIIRTEL